MIKEHGGKQEVLLSEIIPHQLKQRIIHEGEVSQDGAILRLEFLNLKVDVPFVSQMSLFLAEWIKVNIDIQKEKTVLAVVESSGNISAGFIGNELGLETVIIKKKKPATMSGRVISRKIHSFTRQSPTEIFVPASYLAKKDVIGVDDFAATGETLSALKEMVEEAEGKLKAVVGVIIKPNQGSGEVLKGIPSKFIVSIDELAPGRIRFTGEAWQQLKNKWRDL